MKIAIITVNYNGKDDTLEFLESLRRLQRAPAGEGYRLQVIVVDNGSSDGSVSAIHRAYPDVDILQTGANLGYSGGYNKGIEYAQIWEADYFLLVNNDCLIKDRNLVDELINTGESNPEIGLISPKILFAPGFEFHKDRYKDSEVGKVIWFGGGKFDWDNIGSTHCGIDEVDHGQYGRVEESEIISGACVLIKREVLEGVGGLDEKYFLYFEDSDFVKRVKDTGFKIYYNGKVAIYHKVSRSTGIGSKVTDYYHTRNRLVFGMKYAKTRTKLALLRQAIKLFLIGRPAQRQGVLDYYLGLRGGKKELMEPLGKAEYPLKLSIGIVNYNTADLTKKLLQSIFEKSSGFDEKSMEVIVLDNGTADPCQDKIKDFLPNIKYLENKENKGFSKGYNRIVKYSLGEYYLMLNSDIEASEKTLEKILQAGESFKGQAVISGKLVFPNGIVQDSVFHLPTITGALKEYFLRQKGAYFMYAPKGEKTIQIDGAAMAAYLIPRKIMDRVGLLDENIFILFEDVEYARRLKKFDVPVYFDPKAQFLHHHGASTKKQGITKSYEQLKESSMYYHGKIYYWLLYYTLLFCQKFSGTKTPGEIR